MYTFHLSLIKKFWLKARKKEKYLSMQIYCIAIPGLARLNAQHISFRVKYIYFQLGNKIKNISEHSEYNIMATDTVEKVSL